MKNTKPRTTKADNLYCVLVDGKWHSTRELARRVGHTFAGAKYTLTTKHDLDIERQRHPSKRWQHRYRLRSCR